VNDDDAEVQALNNGDTLSESITVTTTDGTPHTIDITILGLNDAPEGRNDAVSLADGGEEVGGDVLSGTHDGNTFFDMADTDVDSDELTVTNISDAGDQSDVVDEEQDGNISGNFGEIEIARDGDYTYRLYDGAPPQFLDDGESRSDVFTYTVSDGSLTDTATLTVTVFGRNDAPVAEDDNGFMFTIDGGEGGDVLENDTDVDNEEENFRVTMIDNPNEDLNPPQSIAQGGSASVDGQFGTLLMNSTGVWEYQYEGGVSGSQQVTESFSYTMSDGDATSNVGALTITIDPDNPFNL
jgi:VCBS repeat-containing protein